MDWLAPIISFLDASKYVLLFFGSFFEGTAVMLTGGVLVQLGQVNFWSTYAALIAGDILSDIGWYMLGYYGARGAVDRWGHMINATPAVVAKIEERFHRYHTRILVISKLTMGFGLAAAILMVAGMLRVPFPRYLTINVIGSFIWVFFIMVVGYYFGNILTLIPQEYQLLMVGVLLVGLVVAFQVINRELSKIDW